MDFEKYTYFEHINSLEAGIKGFVLNRQGNVVAYIDLTGQFINAKNKIKEDV